MKRLLVALILIAILLPYTAAASTAYILKEGSQCEAVVVLQLALSQKGYIEEKYITGYYGKITTEAVKKYQEASGFDVDGVAGQSTLSNLLGSDYKDFFDVELSRTQEQAYNYSPPVSSSGTSNSGTSNALENVGSSSSSYYADDTNTGLLFLGVTSDFVKIIQERLICLNYMYIDKTTNYYGEMTEKAVMNFQSENGLPVNGVIDDKTLVALLSAGAKTSPNPPVLSNSSAGSSSSGSYSPNLSYSSNDLANKIISFAMEQLGKPYKYNTRGTDTFDCSGLVYYAFKNYGITLPTSSSAQSVYEGGKKITSISNLQPGDIVFFNTGNSYVQINHCGIYIGNGQFIHASSSAKSVIIRAVDSGFYYDAFRWAIRVL